MAYCYCIVNIVDFLSTYPIFVQAAPDSRRVPCFYRIHPTALRCTKMLHRSVKAHTSHTNRTCIVSNTARLCWRWHGMMRLLGSATLIYWSSYRYLGGRHSDVYSGKDCRTTVLDFTQLQTINIAAVKPINQSIKQVSILTVHDTSTDWILFCLTKLHQSLRIDVVHYKTK